MVKTDISFDVLVDKSSAALPIAKTENAFLTAKAS